jgi:serine/threonine protein kinase
MARPGGRIKALFDEALEIEAPAERAAYLDRHCAGEPELRRQVEALLRVYAEMGSFLEQPLLDPRATVDPHTGPIAGVTAAPDVEDEQAAPAPPAEGPGSQIGPYKLLQEIGQGGMGAVFLAEQREPVRRQVALKLIKAELASATSVARFEAERQALALMDHPHIAKVLDGGTTSAGRPYFVMELVMGIPITRYCDDQQLSIRQRLELFIPVCQALQHAHTKGIIHRDIKPSNVLVAPGDGQPAPKVIDFGIAKATGQRLTERTLFTEFGSVLGTLEYMSPEQAELNNQDIDTRSDVYSLAVVLYELLTGTTPLTHQVLKGTTFLEVLRRIREEEPPTPSRRLSTLQEALPTISAQRRTEPVKLARALRGELDWVVMKALEKDRSRRYESASALARDLERYLADEPVQARPPSLGYWLAKFARRNRGLVLATAAALLALVVGLAGLAWGLVRAERARQAEAERAEGERQAKEQAQDAEQQARDSEADTQAFSRFLVEDVLAAARPEGEGGGLGIDVSLKRALDESAKKIAQRFRGRPRAEAVARHDLGVTFRLLGDPARAVEQLQQALVLRRQALGRDHPDTLASLNSLGASYRAAGQLDQAVALHEEALRLATAKFGPAHPDTLHYLNNLAAAYFDAGQRARALPLIEEALRLHKARSGPADPQTLASMNNLAVAYHEAGRLDLAEPLYEEALRLRKARLGPEHPDTLMTLGNLAALYWVRRRLDRSIPLFEEVLAIRKKKQGPEHPDTLFVAFNLGVNYTAAGRHADAVALFDQWLPRALATLKPDQPPRDYGVHAGAQAYHSAGRPEKAEPLRRERAARVKQLTGPDSPQYAVALAELSLSLLQQRKWADAEPILRDGLALREKIEPEAWTTFHARAQLGSALLGQQKYAAAEPLLRQGYEGLKQREARIPPDAKSCLTPALEGLVQLYDAWGNKDQADQWRQRLEETRAASRPAAKP